MCCSNRGTVAGRVRSLSDTWEKRDGLQSVGGGEEADSVVGKRGGRKRNHRQERKGKRNGWERSGDGDEVRMGNG